MKLLREKTNDYVPHQVWGQVYYQVDWEVRHQILIQVQNQIKYKPFDQVWIELRRLSK